LNQPTLIDTETLTRLKDWVNKTDKGKVMLIHDVDGDGISSGKLLKEGLKKLGVKVHYRFAGFDRSNVFSDFIMEYIEKNNVETVLITDINLWATNFKDRLADLKDKQIIIFDHHETPEKIPSNVIYFHPYLTYGFEDASQYCTAKLVYDIMSELTDISSLDWVASIGIVSDMNYKTWGGFVDKTLKRLGLKKEGSEFDTELQKVGTYLYYALAMEKEDTQRGIKVFFAAKTYKKALEKLKVYDVVGGEIEHYVTKWQDYADIREDVVFLDITPKYKINSIISTRISVENPSKTFLVSSPHRTHPEIIGFSCRRQDGKIDLSSILHEMKKEIPGMKGGGHKQASGASCKAEDLSKFKTLFVKLHEVKNGK
jgi:single-stranded DNA-specific DHH superfamily exonuclease